MKSQAFFLTGFNKQKSFDLREIDIPEPKPGEVLLEVEAFGLNYADVMARKGLYRDAPPLPCVLGYEVVGRISKVGSDENKELIGKRFVAFTRFGGYAKHVVTSANALISVPENLPASACVALATQYLTAYHMVFHSSHVFKGDNVLVHAAAGGVGTALIQLLKLRGAVVFAKCSSDDKREYVIQQGADYFINYKKRDYEETLREQLNGDFLDLSLNPVGGASVKKDMRLLRKGGGRIILFGGSELVNTKWGILSQLNFVRKMGIFSPLALLSKSQSIIGVNVLRVADYNPKVLAACIQGVEELLKTNKIHPQEGTTFAYSDLEQAHLFLESGKSMGKIAVKWS
jgi:NADPH2:quinone reductase